MGCHALLQGIFPTQGLNLHAFLISPALADRFFATSTTWEALIVILCNLDEFGAVSFPFFESALALKKNYLFATPGPSYAIQDLHS